MIHISDPIPEYPFVDLLHDNSTPFTYIKYLLVTSTNLEAILGSEAYGTITIPTTFSPDAQAYGAGKKAAGNGTEGADRGIYLDAYTVGSDKATVKTRFVDARNGTDGWPLSLYVIPSLMSMLGFGLERSCRKPVAVLEYQPLVS